MTVKTDSYILGINPDDTRNFLLDTDGAGALRIRRRADGSGGLLATIRADGALVMAAPQSMVRVNTGSGYGAVNVCIRRFANVTNGVNGCVIQGTDITRVDNANDATSFVVNTAGVYAISYSDSTSNASGMGLGISLNSTQLSTDINAISVADRLISANTSATANFRGAVSTTVYIPAGGVVRAHADSSGGGGSTATFSITRVA